ncbi:LlaJI family restriction endonuclease, partial [Enorma sp.]|uniref:LlaJI family restriction endonuclease n=1 Tax=Enorma sp. TaxID=1920692 RepID=UPI003AB48F6F
MQWASFCELKPYSLADIATELGCDASGASAAIGCLVLRGIVCLRNSNERNDADSADEIETRAGEVYQFCFVGLVVFEDWVVVVYPKYFCDRQPSEDELRQIFQVLRRTESWSSVAKLVESDERASNRLPVLLALLDLYADQGVYSNYIDGYELNGSGVIEWGRTIGRYLPVLADGTPIYIDFETRKTLCDESDFIARLHRAVLTECSREFVEMGIGELLSVEEVLISEEDVDDFGDVETLVARLERERAIQYIDWKISVLKLLERYLIGRESAIEREDIQSIGTTSFSSVWEKACKVA